MLRTLTIMTCAVALAAAAGCRIKEYCTSHSQCEDDEICDSEHHCIPSACGDGIVYGDEACDDGNTEGGDGCSATCQLESCGNGVTDTAAGEQCDDGNNAGGDGCSATCQLESCGNGTLDPGETCDDGNTAGGDGCSADCLSDESCGNGIADTAVGETCDDGNTAGGDGCSADCQLESCGNGTPDPWETCDDGNNVDGDGCSADCLSDESCGNSIVDTAVGETCDDGNTAGGDGCSADCQLESCGNGTLDPGETCDDGNNVGGDGCSADCLSDESCGNGITDTAAGESCDDGNTVDWDGCMACAVVEFQVNTYTAGDQMVSWVKHPIAIADDGRFVAVWQDTAQDGDSDGVFGQVYDTVGNPVGTEFQVNTHTTEQQNRAAVAMANDGSFVVVWQSRNQVAVDSLYDVYVQRFDSTGSPVGGELMVNSHTVHEQLAPSIAMAPNGSFVIVWASGDQDGSGFGAFGQRFDTGGAPVGPVLQINTSTSGNQSYPAVAMNDDGSFVVVWDGQGDGGDVDGIHGQIFHSTGVMIGTELQVNVTTAGVQRYAAVASSGSNGFVVVWESDTGADPDNYGVYGRRFDAGGTPLTSEFLINTTTAGDQRVSSVASASDGAFTVVWQGVDSAGLGVYGQRFAAGGIPAGGEVHLNSYDLSSQAYPAVAMSAGGSFIAIWSSNVQDGDGNGIFAQRYDDQGNPIAVGQ